MVLDDAWLNSIIRYRSRVRGKILGEWKRILRVTTTTTTTNNNKYNDIIDIIKQLIEFDLIDVIKQVMQFT